jgi:hypothetical protein
MKPRLRVAAKSVDRLRDKLRATFRQGRGQSIERTVETLTPILRGWMNYFRLAQVKGNIRGAGRMAAAQTALHPVAPMETATHTGSETDGARAR